MKCSHRTAQILAVRRLQTGTGTAIFDKQYVRDWLKKQILKGFLPEEVVKKTVDKYVEAYELLSGEKILKLYCYFLQDKIAFS